MKVLEIQSDLFRLAKELREKDSDISPVGCAQMTLVQYNTNTS